MSSNMCSRIAVEPTFSAGRSGAVRRRHGDPWEPARRAVLFRFRARPSRDEARPGRSRPRIELVSASDGRTHRVVETAYGDALLVRAGHCVAVCGHDVVLCALTTPPGPPCRRCAALP